MQVAVTADIVGSRALADRAAAQRALDEALDRVDTALPVAVRRLTPTVGDELQGVFRTLSDALAALLLLRLALPEGVDCRFGVGLGETGVVPSTRGDISEGSAWWAAREAIDTLHARQVRAMPAVRTWVVADPGAGTDVAAISLANAYVWARDELVTSMSARTRRLVYGRCVGRIQRELAADEGITQSAVSQALTTAGASAVVEGFRLLTAG